MKAHKRTQKIIQGDKNSHQTSKIKIQNELISLFPHHPYPTQLKIAQSLYQCLQQQQFKVAIVESPTGTGKTYALLVGVLAWLNKNPNALMKKNKIKQKTVIKQGQQSNCSSNSIPSWVKQKNQENRLNKILRLKQQRVQKLRSIKQAKQNKVKKYQNIKKDNQQNKDKNNKLQWQIQDLQDLQLPDPKNNGKRRMNEQAMTQNIFNDQQCLPKVIFVSRTHSQLSQVMQSISKLGLSFRYASMASKDHLCIHGQIQKTRVHEKCQYLLSHGGCPYYHQQSISDFIGLKVQQSKWLGQHHGMCSYFGTKNILPMCDIVCVPYASILSPQIRGRLGINISNAIVILDQAHNVLQQQLSMRSPEISYKQLQQLHNRIEEYLGKYGGRMLESNVGLLHHMQDICVSFMAVIQGEYETKNRINKGDKAESVVMDEGQDEYYQHIFNQHNNNTGRLNPNNQQQSSYSRLSKLQFFMRTRLQQIKLHKIKTYISLSNFDQKLIHFSKQAFPSSILNTFIDMLTMLMTIDSRVQLGRDSQQHGGNTQKQKQGEKNVGVGVGVNRLYQDHNSIQSTIVLIKNLKTTTNTNTNTNTHIPQHNTTTKKYNKQPPSTSTSTQLLSCCIKIFSMQSSQVAKIAEQARLSILAGGTMEPITSLTSIFNNASLAHTFIKGQHVIKEHQCNVYCIGGIEHQANTRNKESGNDRDRYRITFTYNVLKNESNKLIASACSIIKSIIDKTQARSGTVVFIQSYNLLQSIAEHLGHKYQHIPIYYDTNTNTFTTNNTKPSSSSPSSLSGNAFQQYQQTIKQQKSSAVLVSVMGGKLSQGINFSDQLARSIIVCGLPYPNIKAPEIVEKMAYLDNKHKLRMHMYKANHILPAFQSAQQYNSKGGVDKEMGETGQMYYENCCVKTINQTIGRGIRHINDYANIYLIDHRFGGISHRLPAWMGRSLKHIDYYPCQ